MNLIDPPIEVNHDVKGRSNPAFLTFVETQRNVQRRITILIIVQSVYYLLTALWPLIHIRSFMLVTGPKTDIWLVKTVSALLIPASLTLLSYIYLRHERWPALVLGAGLCIAFIAIDFYYALSDVISDVYLIDGILQIILLFCWLTFGRKVIAKE
jgi:hypothetical protein